MDIKALHIERSRKYLSLIVGCMVIKALQTESLGHHCFRSAYIISAYVTRITRALG